MRYSMVVFDLGGVMVRVAQTWREAVAKAGVACADPENAERRLPECPGFDAFQCGNVGLDDYLATLDDFLCLGGREAALAVHRGILIEPFAGTLELVEELHASGVRTGILSNTNAPHWELMSDPAHFPAIAALQVPALSHVLRSEKPRPEIYRMARDLFGVEPAEILYLDDVEENVVGARSAGWTALHVAPVGITCDLVRGALNGT